MSWLLSISKAINDHVAKIGKYPNVVMINDEDMKEFAKEIEQLVGVIRADTAVIMGATIIISSSVKQGSIVTSNAVFSEKE